MIVTKPTPKSLYEIIKHTTGKTQEVIVVDIAQLLEAAKEHTIPGIQLTYKGEEIIYEDLEKAARKQRKNDRAYTKEFIDEFVDGAYTPQDIMAMLGGIKPAEELKIRATTKEAITEGIERFLMKTQQPCCIFHSNTEWFSEDRAVEYAIERGARRINQSIDPVPYASHVSSSLVASVQTYQR